MHALVRWCVMQLIRPPLSASLLVCSRHPIPHPDLSTTYMLLSLGSSAASAPVSQVSPATHFFVFQSANIGLSAARARFHVGMAHTTPTDVHSHLS
ncbi:hypothetical protein L226DRAFT_386546 [Lentinus tigrinus ALCF2SS1-7]|uniref:uncharacterized protein n=1 Tax=Lentinus tigrinus ALCF2SS1-7 TaxID=1328758 RepID=UPI001165FDFA|nr:hypothetical protein L226DRAFT_386546 [Lentinus tigrinus ALCF2SS1-7]